MLTILIDPFQNQITEELITQDYKDLYKLLDCEMFDAIRINDQRDSVFIDDEGLYKPDQQFFMIEGYPQPIAGKGLIIGSNEAGESQPPKITLQEARDSIIFLSPLQVLAWSRNHPDF
jgi:hypothetical protein